MNEPMPLPPQKRYPFDLIDLFFILIAPQDVTLVVMACAQWVLRHWETPWHFLIDEMLLRGWSAPPGEWDRIFIPAIATYQPPALPALPETLPPALLPPAAPRHARGTATTTPEEDAAETIDDLAPLTLTLAPDLLDVLDPVLHLLVVGHSGGGKTTLIHALACQWAEHGRRVLVLDPDAAPGVWPGCQVVGGGDNWPAIERALTSVREIVARRRQARANGETRQFTTLCVIMDEYADVVRHVAPARELVETILRRGRKLGVHLVIGVQDRLVKTMGLEGQGDLRRNFTYTVDVTVVGDRRQATIHEHDASNSFIMPVPTLPDPESLVAGNLAGNHDGDTGGTQQSQAVQTTICTSPGTSMMRSGTTPNTPPILEKEPPTDGGENGMIRQLLAAGHSKNAVARLLGGSKTRAYERINQAMAEFVEVAE
jgi:energy-coupling factor transporter ATP-binding protein EcfA2